MRSVSAHSGTREEAGAAVRRRAEDVADAAENLLDRGDRDGSPERVHRLRVASRRALAALDACGLAPDDPTLRALRRRIRSLRRAGGAVRDCDVHAELLGTLRDRPGAPPGIHEALELIGHDRRMALDQLRAALLKHRPGAIRRGARRVRDAVRQLPTTGTRRSMTAPDATDTDPAVRLEAAAAADLAVPAHLHELRLSIKALRYTRELGQTGLKQPRAAADRSLLAAAQTRLGEVNDIATLVARLRECIEGIVSQHPAEAPAPTRRLAEELRVLHDRFASVLAARCEAAAGWWRQTVSRRPSETSLADFLMTAAEPLPPEETANMPQPLAEAVTPSPHSLLNGVAPSRQEPSQANLWVAGLKVGVIDVGSNSVRLLVAEMIDERSWRVLREERSMTRLAHGLACDGLLATDAMARSVEAVGRFKSVAEDLGVGTVRAFATAAVRDARNGGDFVSLVSDRTGLTLEIISGAEEGRLTFRSVARVHDLSQGTAAIVDMGGGSMEVVLSDGGVITRNVSMPLGALRITEQFGGAEACCTLRFKDMRRFLEHTIATRVPRPPTPPAVLSGCGGTFTTILTLAAASRGILVDRNHTSLASLGPVSREQVRVLIDQLRAMTPEQRLRVPGLPSDRADIVVAGMTAVERLMKHLGCTQLLAHAGGVREGLVMKIVDEHLASRVKTAGCTDSQVLEDARDLARRCRYERAHSEHVSSLAVSLYDQFLRESELLQGLGSEPHERALLAAAAILHDIGIMVEYRAHHKHSARIIRQEGLGSCTPRQVELIALIARYHRRGRPSAKNPAVAALSPEDQALVSRLAGLLRVADGLDRPHAQTARAVRLHSAQSAVRIEVDGEGDLQAETRAALKKVALLERVLGMSVEITPASPTTV